MIFISDIAKEKAGLWSEKRRCCAQQLRAEKDQRGGGGGDGLVGGVQNICWHLKGWLSADSLSNTPLLWDFIYDNSLQSEDFGTSFTPSFQLRRGSTNSLRREKDFGFFLKLNPLPGLRDHPLQCQGLLPPNLNWNSLNTKENLSVQGLAPIDIANLWKAVNRIRIIMGEFGCTQIRTSYSCSSKRNLLWQSLFLLSL